eukprot:scaffold1026_cov409-Prasinococcus_capsulatus_cf.AAC.32
MTQHQGLGGAGVLKADQQVARNPQRRSLARSLAPGLAMVRSPCSASREQARPVEGAGAG